MFNIIKYIYLVLFLLIFNGCKNTTPPDDIRNPLINTTPFTNFVPIEIEEK